MRALSSRAQLTRDKILKAANELFYTNGYHATSVDRIIADAGITKGNFFYHFKSKEDLAGAVLRWHQERTFTQAAINRLLHAPSARQALYELLQSLMQRMSCQLGDGKNLIRGCIFGNFALELAASSESIRRILNDIFGQVRELIRQLLTNAQLAREIREDLDPGRTAQLILGMMEGAVLLDKAGQSQQETLNAIEFIESYLKR
jgi:TetR/AcrR family transcriptional repressor of nem operon